MALGFVRFDADLHVRGILFNRLSGEGHYRLLKQAVERHTDLEVVGYLERDDSLSISERHLGLVTANNQVPDHLYARLADAIDKTVDLDRIQSLARSAVELEEVSAPYVSKSPDFAGTRVGVAQDEAFCFYYQDNLELLQAEGAELVPFSPLGDAALPDVQLLYLGGGYPEVHAERLRNNKRMRTAVREYATSGGAIYAECGGLMYLMEAIRDFNGKVYDMVGLFPGEAVMSRTSMTLGYRQVEIAKTCVIGEAGMKIRGHEFHYSTLSLRRTPEYSCATTDAAGDRRGQDGLLAGNVIALYTHLHFSSQPQLARALLHSARAASLKREDR
jgi:cobyrinic acid a,c-diamide synthase